ncbi:MAG: M36 family metallopeptidase, partial [Bacteroidota bacterium]
MDKHDWVIECTFPDHDHANHAHTDLSMPSPLSPMGAMDMLSGGPAYRVIPHWYESPNHGPDSLLQDPADVVSSPFGWHDTDGVPGYEYTITRGNNVWASEDRDANNVPGYSPDGDTCLVFDFAFNLNQAPLLYQDAAITNLFYMNNIMHDYAYNYGFDEQAGNFQENNYGNGGLGNDYVFADAQDGSGLNNANFATPGDGANPRMQMFLWGTGGCGAEVVVNSPGGIAGTYGAGGAAFGPGLTPSVTADLVLVNDGTNPDPEDACDPIINASALVGKIAVIDRGNCTFVSKVEAAQAAGAVGVIIVNNTGGAVINMGGASATITIPSVMLTQADGNLIKTQLNAGNTV